MKYIFNVLGMLVSAIAARNSQVHHGQWMLPALSAIAFMIWHAEFAIEYQIEKLRRSLPEGVRETSPTATAEAGKC